MRTVASARERLSLSSMATAKLRCRTPRMELESLGVKAAMGRLTARMTSARMSRVVWGGGVGRGVRGGGADGEGGGGRRVGGGGGGEGAEEASEEREVAVDVVRTEDAG